MEKFKNGLSFLIQFSISYLTFHFFHYIIMEKRNSDQSS